MNKKWQKEVAWLIRDKYAGRLDPVRLTEDIKRLNEGEPLAYVIGYTPFLNCQIDLRFRPLIPRAETEFWVELAINNIYTKSCTVVQDLVYLGDRSRIKCLDIFSGSGCIGIAILKHVPGASVVFAEKSAKFCRQIEKNLEQNGIAKDRYRIIRANIFRPFGEEKITEKFDYILANPPYIPEERKNKLDKGVVDWEPPEALFAKDKGLLVIKRFLEDVKGYLDLSGQVWLEFDVSQNLLIKDLLAKGGFNDVVFHKDQYSRWRFVTFRS